MRRRPTNSGREDVTFFSPALPRVFAHRGLAVDAPENTMLAFLKALSLGIAYVETDVHASHDGVAVIAHDADLARVAGRQVRVDQLTMAELRRVDLGGGQSFVSLAEALDAFPEARFNIDIKTDAAVRPTVAAIAEAGAEQRVLVTSFNDRRRREALKGLPGVATSGSRRTAVLGLLAVAVGSRTALRMVVRRVDALQLPERMRGVRIVTPRLVRLLHDVGVEVHVWTVNDRPSMERLLSMGVDGLVTDRADVAAELVSDRR